MIHLALVLLSLVIIYVCGWIILNIIRYHWKFLASLALVVVVASVFALEALGVFDHKAQPAPAITRDSANQSYVPGRQTPQQGNAQTGDEAQAYQGEVTTPAKAEGVSKGIQGPEEQSNGSTATQHAQTDTEARKARGDEAIRNAEIAQAEQEGKSCVTYAGQVSCK